MKETAQTASNVQPFAAEAPRSNGLLSNAVHVLRSNGLETLGSYEGSEGPTIKFHGNAWNGYKAMAIAMENGLDVACVRRVWGVVDGELEGPWWELVLTLSP